MKNKILKITWLFIIFAGLLLIIYLVFFPIKHSVQFACYNVNDEITFKTYSSKVSTIIKINRPEIFRLIVFLGNENHDNFNISMKDSNGQIIFNQHYKEYQSSIALFEFLPLNIGENYILTIEELDGDILNLPTVKSNGITHLENDNNYTIRIGAAYREKYNFAFWYPLFAFVFAFTLYPFIWKDDKNEK